MTNQRQPISFVVATDAEKARTFYEETLGLELIEASPYALVFSDGGNMLRVQIVRELHPAPHTAHGWKVADIEREIEDLISKGVSFLHYDQVQQNPSGVWTTPDGNKIAWFKDPSGNILSLTEFT